MPRVAEAMYLSELILALTEIQKTVRGDPSVRIPHAGTRLEVLAVTFESGCTLLMPGKVAPPPPPKYYPSAVDLLTRSSGWEDEEPTLPMNDVPKF